MMVNVLVASMTGIAAAAQLVAGGLAWSGKLPGNGVVGLNIPEVRTSRERWDAAHRIAGPLWTLSGVALVFATLIAVVASGWLWLAFAFAWLRWVLRGIWLRVLRLCGRCGMRLRLRVMTPAVVTVAGVVAVAMAPRRLRKSLMILRRIVGLLGVVALAR